MTATDTYTALPEFEGEEVARATVRITRAGDGLSEALKIAPKALALDEEVFYVLRGRVTQVNHRETEEKVDGERDTVLVRVHTVEALAITEIDPGIARQYLDAASERIRKARDATAGQASLLDGSADGED